MLFAADTIDPLISPVVEHGITGVCAVVLAFLFVYVPWITKQLLTVIKANTRVIDANTSAITKVSDGLDRHEAAAMKRHDDSQTQFRALRDTVIDRLAAKEAT